jgi:hypothetical protein
MRIKAAAPQDQHPGGDIRRARRDSRERGGSRRHAPSEYAGADSPPAHIVDLAAPLLRPVGELARPLRFDQARESSATPNATRQFAQTNFDVESGQKSAFAI